MKAQNRLMVEMDCSLVNKTKSNGILLYADLIEGYEALFRIGQEKRVNLVLAIKDDVSYREASPFFNQVLRLPSIPLGRINQVKIAILQALSVGLVKKGEGGIRF